MIRNLGKLFLTLCLLAVGGGVVANAQISTIPGIQADVPFAFQVGDTTLPAGKYDIKALDDNEPNVLEIRSVNGGKSIVFETEDAQKREDKVAKKTELVFDKVGDQYFLSQVWVEGTPTGSELAKSKSEKRLEDGGSQSEKHSVVAFLKHK
jgi:hypothetical protein